MSATPNLRPIHLTAEKETLLITLYARAQDYRSPHSILGDKAADEIVRSLDYDFSKFNSAGNDNLTVVRARQFDDWTREFVAHHPDAVVLYLGCGLDTRAWRVNSPASVAWYDVDYPEVIALRQSLFPPRDGYSMIASSITADSWLDWVPGARPTLIIAEGVLEYLAGADVRTLLNRLTARFQHGQIAFDVMNSFAVNAGKRQLQQATGATHQWAVDDTGVITQFAPRLRKLSELSVMALPALRRLPWQYQVLYTGMRAIPQFRHMIRLLRYEF